MSTTPELSPFQKAYNLSVQKTGDVYDRELQKFGDAKERSREDLRGKTETEEGKKQLHDLADQIYRRTDDNIRREIRSDWKETNRKVSSEDERAFDKIFDVIKDSRTSLIENVLFPALSDISKNQILENDRVRTETRDLLNGLKERVNTTYRVSLEKKYPEEALHIQQLQEDLTKVVQVPQDQKEKALEEVIDPKFDEYIGPVYEGILKGEIGFSSSEASLIIEYAKDPKRVATQLKNDPYALQYLHDLIETREKRFQKYSSALHQVEKKRTDGKSMDESQRGKMKIFADYALTKIALEARSQILQDEELKKAYESANQGRTAQEVQIYLNKASQEEPGAFANLLQKPDGIVRFLVRVMGPLWLKFTGAVNAITFLQNPKNQGALLYATAGIGLGVMLDRNKQVLDPDDKAFGYYENLSPLDRSRFWNFFCDGEKGELETRLAQTVNWKEVRSSSIAIKGDEKDGWGKEEMQNPRSKGNYVGGTVNQEIFDTTLPKMDSSHFNEEWNKERRWVYKKLMGDFTLHETRTLIGIIKNPPKK